MNLSLIVAMARNRVIGHHNKIPWHLSEDLKRFKQTTMGHPIIMGRKTFESISRPLPGRENIVVTRNPHFAAEDVTIVHSLDEALNRCGEQEAFVIGGEQIYREALPQVSKLYLTLIDRDFEGDAFFPEIDFTRDFCVIDESEIMRSEQEGFPYRFIVAKRNSSENDSVV